MNKPLLLIKLGGSVITDKTKPYTARLNLIYAIGKILKQVAGPMIIAHGSGSFAHTSASKFGGKNGYSSRLGIATVARDAMAINSIVVSALIELKIPAISLRPMSFLTSSKGILKNSFYSPLELTLSQGLVPVVYGDVIWDESWKSTIFSGETILSQIAVFLQSKGGFNIRIVELCDVDGVLDKDGKVIPEITQKNWELINSDVTAPTANDVTGGMRHKIEEALLLAKQHIASQIVNGQDTQLLKKVLLENKPGGTLIH